VNNGHNRKPTTADVIKSCDEATEMMADLVGELKAKPLPQRPRSPEPVPEPDLSPDAKAVKAMLEMGNQRIGRPANAFYGDAAEHLERLVGSIRSRCARIDEDYLELGRELRDLKDLTKGTAWPKALKEHKIPLKRARADELIRVFEGKTTVVEVRQKRRKRDSEYRAKTRSAVVDSKSSVSHRGKSDIPDVHALMSKAFAFLCDFEPGVRAWKKADHHTAEDEAQLISAIHEVAEGLVLLAQELQEEPHGKILHRA
jgi:hypothetical protein